MRRAIETLRLYTLLLTIPATVLWARTLGPATGALLVATHAALIIFYNAWSVRHDLERGLAPRLGLARTREFISRETLDLATPVSFFLLAGLSVALLIANFWIGFGAILATAAAVWHGRQPLDDKLVRVELIAPIGLLAGPGLLFRLHAWAPPESLQVFSESPGGPVEASTVLTGRVVRPEVISIPSLGATLLAAAVMLIVILLCLVRDRSDDELDGVATTPTRLGRSGAAALVWMWMLGVAALASIGVGAGWWHWSAALIASWTAAAVLATLSARLDEWAVRSAVLGGAALAMVVTTTL